MDKGSALDATDEALAAQIVRTGGEADVCDFTHALIRHTLYGELTPPRQVRLHRQIAEAMEDVYGDRVIDHAGELAYQFHRGGGLPGMQRGVTYALAAAARAEEAGGWDESVAFLRMALDLLPVGDDRRARVLAKMSIALAWTQAFDESASVAIDAAALLAASESNKASADYLVEAARAVWGAGGGRKAWELASEGLNYIGDGRDRTYAWLMGFDRARREADDPTAPGIAIDSAERRALVEMGATTWTNTSGHSTWARLSRRRCTVAARRR